MNGSNLSEIEITRFAPSTFFQGILKSAALYTKIEWFLDMKESKIKPNASYEDVIHHAKEILKSLNSPLEVKSKTLSLIEQADMHYILASCSSIGAAAGLVYTAGILTGNPVTLEGVAKKAGISSETVRKYKTHIVSSFKKMNVWSVVSQSG